MLPVNSCHWVFDEPSSGSSSICGGFFIAVEGVKTSSENKIQPMASTGIHDLTVTFSSTQRISNHEWGLGQESPNGEGKPTE